MAEVLWLIVFVGLLIFAFRQPKGKRWGWVVGAFIWFVFFPSLMNTRTSSTAPANAPATASNSNLSSSTIKKQPGSLRILVNPEDARITVQGPFNYYRKVSGSNKFGNLPPGEYKVTISKPGYETVTEVFKVTADSNQSATYRIKSLTQIAAEKRAAELEAQREAVCSGIQLVIEDWRWGQSSDSFVKVEGRVTNVSGVSLKGVVAKVSFFSQNEEFITSDDALIDYQPVLNGQTSPFSVIAIYNPAMRKAQLELAQFWGTTYRFTDRKTWNKYRCGQR
jgi:hypothetical protein